MSNFEEQIVRAIVDQFFVGFEYRTDYGTQRQDAPAKNIASQLLSEHSKEILDKIWNKLDKDQFAKDVAEKMSDRLKGSSTWTREERDSMQKRIWTEYAKIKAQEMLDKDNQRGEE